MSNSGITCAGEVPSGASAAGAIVLDAPRCGIWFHVAMRRPGELLAHLHDLRVLISSIQLHADEVLGTPDESAGSRYALHDQVNLLAEILRAWTMIEARPKGEPDARPFDLRAIVFLARVRHPSAFLGEMSTSVRAHVRPDAVLELMDLVSFWAAGENGRTTIEVRDLPPSIVISAVDHFSDAVDRSDRELEQAITSVSAACRVEALLESEQRVAVLQFRGEDEGFDG